MVAPVAHRAKFTNGPPVSDRRQLGSEIRHSVRVHPGKPQFYSHRSPRVVEWMRPASSFRFLRKDYTRMEFNKNEAGNLAGATAVGTAGPGAGEIDLYDELETFAGLSPEEQQRLLARPNKAVEEAVAATYSDSESTNVTSNAVRMETPKPQPESISEVKDSVRGETSEVSSEATKGSSSSGSPALPSVTAENSPSDSGDSAAKKKTGDLSPQLFDRSRTGPLLAGLNVLGDLVFAGDLSRGVCLACGAGSAAEDLFCVSCGVFIDDIDSTPNSSPTCGECGQSVTAEEIFCPWCGAAPA
jgi:hypothetical protein